MGFASFKATQLKLKELLDSKPYVMMFQFHNESTEPVRIVYKKHKGKTLQNFFTVLRPQKPHSGDDTWNALMVPNSPKVLKRSDIRLYQKWFVGKTLYYEIEPILDAAGVEEFIGIDEPANKQVLILDIVEKESDIQAKLDS